MPDCFISYGSPDEKLATFVAQYLRWRKLSVFMARISLEPGDVWNEEIRRNLRESPWVLFLASRQTCASPYVQQEIGGAHFGGKKLVPIVWDMPRSHLPGWAKHYQALDLRGLSPEEVTRHVERIAQVVHASKRKGALIASGLIAGLILLAKGRVNSSILTSQSEIQALRKSTWPSSCHSKKAWCSLKFPKSASLSPSGLARSLPSPSAASRWPSW